jgi:hypothetical protein
MKSLVVAAAITRACVVRRFEAQLRDYTERRARANAFDLRYAGDVVPRDERWELCEKVLARNDVKKRLSRGWGEREKVNI